MSEAEKRLFVKEFSDALRNDSAAVFVGAGASQPAGFVNWKQLLKGIAEDLQLDVNRESDLVALAQYHLNDRGSRDKLNQLLIDEFLETHEPTETHKLLASLPLHTVWTTNYDDLLERAFEMAGKRVDVKRRRSDFSVTRRRTDVTVYKMHGDKTEPAAAILAKDDYETYHPERELFTMALKGDLTVKTFLFVGVSFTDPNLTYILSRVRQLVDVNGRQHYCLLRKPKSTDYAGADYDCAKFPHFVTDLKRYKIKAILLDSYAEIPDLLREINRRSHLRDVFVSGSAADYGPMGEEKFRELCRTLGGVLVKNNFNLISGFGVGVGGDVITGALQSLPRNDDERLQLWPFPQHLPKDVDRASFWRQYRERMISEAGVCLVLSGNKLVGGSPVVAGGVKEEIDITKSQGKIILPIGSTGYAAREAWNEVSANPSAFFGKVDVSKPLAILGDDAASVDDIVKAVLDILSLINR